MTYYFFTPASINVYYFRLYRNYIFLSYKTKYFVLPLSANFSNLYNSEFNIISVRIFKKSHSYRRYFSMLNYFIFSWVSFLSKKIKFKHKGAWISVLNSKSRFLILNFRLAHLSYLFNQRVFIRRRKKHFSFHTLLCLGYSTESLLRMGVSMYNFFKLNKFTFRGIRFSRHRLIKKEGKVSKYMIDLKK